MVQLGGEGAFAITEDIRPYGGTLPLLMYPAVAEATCHNRETLLQGGAGGSRAETTAEGRSLHGKGRTSHQQGGASAGKK